MDKRGLLVRSNSIEQIANLLLQKRSTIDYNILSTVGKNWAYRFIKRYDSLQSKYNRKYDYARTKCEDPTVIRAWFRLMRNIITKYGILDKDIYNFDKTSF